MKRSTDEQHITLMQAEIFDQQNHCFGSVDEISSELPMQDCSKHCRIVQGTFLFKTDCAELITMMCSSVLLLMLGVTLS